MFQKTMLGEKDNYLIPGRLLQITFAQKKKARV